MSDLLRDLINDAEDIDKSNYSICTILLMIIALFMCIVNIIYGTTVMVYITGILSVFELINFFLCRKTQKVMVSSIGTLSLLLAVFVYFLVSGGENGFSIVWTLLIPPLGIFLFKLLYGGAFSIIMGLIIAVYMWTPLNAMGYAYTETFLTRFPIVYFFDMIICIYINYTILLNRKKQIALLQMAQQASTTKGDFLANMSHEIRTPLNAVVGMCELILRESDISDTVRDYCFNIQNSGRSLLSIINDILDFSKIESGKMELINEEFNIASTINDVINMAITRKGDKPIELIVKCDPDIPMGLVGDELRIRQVMINLVTNAIKFTHNGCVVIRLSKTTHDYGINLSFSVADTGIGITPENLEKLFSSFQQVNTKKNRAVEGTGLGLAISKKFITSMGGFINVSSVSGSGSEFRFVIPLKVSDPKPFISIKENDGINAVFFMDMTKFGMPRVAKEYKSLIDNMSESFNTDISVIDSFDKLNKEFSENKLTHIFTGREEYIANKAFFDRAAENVHVVLVQDRINAIDVPQNMKCIYKPFYSLTLASIFNNENLLSNINERRNSSVRFIAPNARVLVVDDNVINLKVAVGLMRPYHMQVLTVDSGRAAISMLRSKDIDIVFMDHMMPEMDGIETTKAIRNMNGEYYKKLPIIALTANAVNGVRDMYIEAGLNDFIAKPIELSTLDRALKTWLPRELIKTPTREERYPRKRRKTDTPAPADKKENNNDLFNIETGVFYTGGDTEAYNEILEVYVRKAQEKHDCIKKLFEEKSWKNYVIEVHALKSSSLTIGSKTLSELAKELELSGKAGNYDVIEQKNDALLAMYLQVAELGRKYLENIGGNKDTDDTAAAEMPVQELPELPAEKLTDFIEKIKTACDAFDGDTAAQICDEAVKFAVNGTALRPFFEAIKADVNDFEYDSAAEKAAAVPEKIGS